MKNHPLLTKGVISIMALTAILITAMVKNIDGVLVATGLAIIAGLGGYITGKIKKP